MFCLCLICDQTLPRSYAGRDLFGLKVTHNEGCSAGAGHGFCKGDVLPEVMPVLCNAESVQLEENNWKQYTFCFVYCTFSFSSKQLEVKIFMIH